MLHFNKKIIFIFLIIFIVSSASFILAFANCNIPVNSKKGPKVKIIASLFPQYDFAKQIAKEKAEVTLILPPGTESHTYDPTPNDIIKISNSDIFLFTGEEMEPWAGKIANSVVNSNVTIKNVSDGIELFKTEHHHEDHDEDEHDHKFDPHIWLDPNLSIKIVDNITLVLIEKDPENAEFYKKNAENYKAELTNLDHEFKNLSEMSKRKTIVFDDRFSCLYFVKRYNFKHIAAFDTCSTESEPSTKKVSEIINFIKENNVPVVYYEGFNEPKIAKFIFEQTGAKSLRFNTLHNVTKEQLENNCTYISLMRENLENLKQGLN